MSSYMNDDALSCAMDENTDLKARILRLEYEISTLRSIIESIKSALGSFGRGQKPAPLVATDAAAVGLIGSGIFKPGQVINVGQQKMFVAASGQLKPVKYFPDVVKFDSSWESRGYYIDGLVAGDLVLIGEKVYRVDEKGGLSAP